MARWFRSSRALPQPTVDDVASTFFTLKTCMGNAHAPACAAAASGGAHGGIVASRAAIARDGGSCYDSKNRVSAGGRDGGEGAVKFAGPWRPGAAAISPGLGPASEGSGGG